MINCQRDYDCDLVVEHEKDEPTSFSFRLLGLLLKALERDTHALGTELGFDRCDDSLRGRSKTRALS